MFDYFSGDDDIEFVGDVERLCIGDPNVVPLFAKVSDGTGRGVDPDDATRSIIQVFV